MRTLLFLSAILTGTLSISSNVLAKNDTEVQLTMRNQQFDPNRLLVSAGIQVKIILNNLDSVPGEFESYDLALDVIVQAHSKKTINIGPLNPGNYRIFNGFNLPMQGWIVAKPAVN